jgi:hypothetical protein
MRTYFRKLNESDTNSDWYHDLYTCLDKNELSKMIFDYPDFANKKYKIEVEEEKEKRRWEILSIVNALIYKIKEYSYFLEDL